VLRPPDSVRAVLLVTLKIDGSGKAEVEHRMADHTSLMPDGLAAGLSQRDFADLIAYLETF